MGGRREYVKLSVDLPHFKLDLKSANPTEAVSHVRRILEALPDHSVPFFEEPELYELRSRLSEEFFGHQGLIDRLRSSLVLDEEVRIGKQVLPVTNEVDLETGRESLTMNVRQVKDVLTTMLDSVTLRRVRECLVHIRGELTRDDQCVIMDCIKQRFGLTCPVRFFLTRKNLEGNVLVEAVCFGEGVE